MLEGLRLINIITYQYYIWIKYINTSVGLFGDDIYRLLKITALWTNMNFFYFSLFVIKLEIISN